MCCSDFYPSQVHLHDVAAEDRVDGPQCSAAPPGHHSGLSEGPGRLRETVPRSLPPTDHHTSKRHVTLRSKSAQT